MRLDTHFRNINQGFTLVEMAVVMVIIGLVMGALLIPLTAQLENQRRSETQRRLEAARDALYGFTIVNGYLPCPDRTTGGTGTANDTANDGIEDYDTATGNCQSNNGNLPWSTLALPNSDDWEEPIIYATTPAFSAHPPATSFGITSNGVLRICNESTCSAPRLTDNAAAVLVSTGPNAGVCNTGTCIDEVQNTNGDNDFVNHGPTANGVAGTEYFDDMVVWLSPSVLISKMIDTGRLP